MNDREVSARFDAADACRDDGLNRPDIALIFFRRDVLHLHDRLEQNRFALLKAVFHREDRRELERQFVRIDFVKLP